MSTSPLPDHAPGGMAGLRVLDLTWAQAGPLATLLLADLGADVLKVEPKAGDISRRVPPFPGGLSWVFSALNRGKRSIRLDLKDPEDHRWILGLIDGADVVVENFAPGVMDRLGLGARTLRERNPRLVYASCSGFGQDDTAAAPAFDLVIQALSGVMQLTGEPGSGPVRVGFSSADIGGALYLTIAILQALLERERTGRGTRVDVSMMDAQTALLWDPIGEYLATGHAPEKLGSRHALAAPFQGFATADGDVVVAVVTDAQFAGLCRALGRAELAADERFATGTDRVANVEALDAELAPSFAALATERAVAWLTAERVPAAPVLDVARAVDLPYVRRMLIDLGAHGSVIGSPVRREGEWLRRPDPAPRLGEHEGGTLWAPRPKGD